MLRSSISMSIASNIVDPQTKEFLEAVGKRAD
jgi:hypothetical protein